MVPAKVMWYAPIIPRLKRLFRNGEHAKLMRCHSEDRKKDGKLRAPADGSQGRNIKRKYWDEFAKDPRNVWFALSADGINPFGEQSSNHSTWPVTLCMYNLPPWMCMRRKFIMLGNVVISKNFLRTRKIMVMHSNERGECCLRTLVNRSGSDYNVEEVVVRSPRDPINPAPLLRHLRVLDTRTTR